MATKVVEAVYQGGVFKPKEPVDLDEDSNVRLTIERPVLTREEDPTGWKTARELIGCIKDGPSDMAENHDKYLYGDSDD